MSDSSEEENVDRTPRQDTSRSRYKVFKVLPNIPSTHRSSIQKVYQPERSGYEVLPNIPSTPRSSQQKVYETKSNSSTKVNQFTVLLQINTEINTDSHKSSSSKVIDSTCSASSVSSEGYIEFEAINPYKGEEETAGDRGLSFYGTETTVLKCIKDVLSAKTTNNVVIIGKAGTGKTTIGRQLINTYKNDFHTNHVTSVVECLQSLNFDKDQLIFFDDIFGREIIDFKRKKWEVFFQKCEEVEITKTKELKRTILVMSSRSQHLLTHFKFPFLIVDLDGEENVLNIDDKNNILRFHLQDSGNFSTTLSLQDDTITKTEDDIGFPLCSRLYSHHFKMYGIPFFKSPLQFLHREFKSRIDKYETARCLSCIMAICNGMFRIDYDFENEDVMYIMQTRSLDPDYILECAKLVMKPFITKRDAGIIQFVHPSLLTVSEIIFFNTDKERALQRISLETIVSYVDTRRLSATGKSKTYRNIEVEHLEKGDLQFLAQRLIQEMLNGNIQQAYAHRLLDDIKFVQIFYESLKKLQKNSIPNILSDLFSVRDNEKGESIIFWGALHNKRIFCQKLLQRLGKYLKAEPDLSPSITSRALVAACLHKTSIILIIDLVRHGADINYCSRHDVSVRNEHLIEELYLSPLEAVVHSKNQNCLKYLLRKGACIPHSRWTRWDLISHISKASGLLVCSLDFIMALKCVFSDTNNDSPDILMIENDYLRYLKCMLNQIRDPDNINEIFFIFLRHGFMNLTICESFKHFGLKVNYLDSKNRNVLLQYLWEYQNSPSLIPSHIIPCLQFLLKENCDPNNEAFNGSFPLSFMIGKTCCHVQCFEMLLTAGADPEKMSFNGLTPMHLCIKSDISEKDKLSLVSLLLEFGCSLDILDRTGKSYGEILLQRQNVDPAILALISEFPLHDCLTSKRKEDDKIKIVNELIISHSVDINSKDTKGRTALMISSIKIFSKCITKTLLRHGADPNITNESGSSIIQQLLQSNHTNVCELLEVLCDVVENIRHMNDEGDTLVHTALKCSRNRYHEINFILDYCDFDNLVQRNKYNQTGLHLVAACCTLDDSEALNLCKTYFSVSSNIDELDMFYKTPLAYAASCPKKRSDTIIYLLRYDTAFQSMDTVLIDLVKHGHFSKLISDVLQEREYYNRVVKQDEHILLKLSSTAPKTRAQIDDLVGNLCKQGVSINNRDERGNSALLIACRKTMNIGLVSTLIDRGADVNLQNEHGNTALHECILSESTDIILNKMCQIFAKAGFDWFIRNSSGNSVFHSLIDNMLSEKEQTFKTLARLANINSVDFDGNSVLHKMLYLRKMT